MNNTVILVGRLYKDIELRTTQSGMKTCYLPLAITRNYKNAEGKYETDFVNCICFKQIAEMCSNYLKKGDLIGIKGMIQSRSYEKDGKKIYATDIVVEKLTFLSTTKKEESKVDPLDKAVEEFSNEIQVTGDMLPF